MSTLIYLDTSALLSIIFKETAHEKCLKALKKAEQVFSSNLILSETASSLKREHIDLSIVEDYLSRIDIVTNSTSFSTIAEVLHSGGYLRGADLHHVATAKELAKNRTREIFFLTLDTSQNDVAKKLGFKTIS